MAFAPTSVFLANLAFAHKALLFLLFGFKMIKSCVEDPINSNTELVCQVLNLVLFGGTGWRLCLQLVLSIVVSFRYRGDIK